MTCYQRCKSRGKRRRNTRSTLSLLQNVKVFSDSALHTNSQIAKGLNGYLFLARDLLICVKRLFYKSPVVYVDIMSYLNPCSSRAIEIVLKYAMRTNHLQFCCSIIKQCSDGNTGVHQEVADLDNQFNSLQSELTATTSELDNVAREKDKKGGRALKKAEDSLHNLEKR